MAAQLLEALHLTVMQQDDVCNVKGMYKELNAISVNQAHQTFKLATPSDVVDVCLLLSAFYNSFQSVFDPLSNFLSVAEFLLLSKNVDHTKYFSHNGIIPIIPFSGPFSAYVVAIFSF